MNDLPQSGMTPVDLGSDFELMVDAIPQLAWITRPDGWIFWYNRRWFDYTGTTLEEMQGWGWRSVHHPDHIDRVVEKFSKAVEAGEPWEDVFPLRHRDGEYRWFLSRAMPIRDASGQIVRWFGTNTDITEQKRTEERQTLLMREIDHRAKNALSVALAVVRLTSAPSTEVFKHSVEGRISALARVHGHLAASRWQGADLKQLITEELEPFQARGAVDITLEGPELALPPASAQSLALIAHELATNASKYGALSRPGGRIDVAWKRTASGVSVTWKETVPFKIDRPATSGFGSTLLTTLVGQFEDGQMSHDWREDGLTVRISGALERSPGGGAESLSDTAAEGRARSEDRNPTVLIVEDEALTAMDLAKRVTDAGYRVIGPSGTMDQAREAVDREMPDLALLDCNVRGERSWELAEQLVAAGVPVVFCTGYERMEGLPASLAACPTIPKPFNEAELLAAIRTGLRED